MIVEWDEITGDRREDCDVVVIGSGCGGATLAKAVAAAGRSVVILERGGHYTAARGDLDQRADDMLARIDGGRGLDTTTSGEIALTYGNCVGGASVHYWADSWRLPDDRAAAWARAGVAGHEASDLAPHFDRDRQRDDLEPGGPGLRHDPRCGAVA